MPSATIDCVLCQKSTTANNICGHLMTHKADLAPLVKILPDLFATVQKDDEEELYCCFGCKKSSKDKKRIRDHMKSEDLCRKKHDQFLKDIGVNLEAIKVGRFHSDENKETRQLANEIERLKNENRDLRENTIFATRINSLESDLAKAMGHIRRMEEFYRMIPAVMDPKLLTYCNKFVNDYKALQTAIIPGQMKQRYREQYLRILESTPLLQLYMLPDFNFMLNQHHMNGEYLSMLGGYFNRLDYRPSEAPVGDWDKLSPLPTIDLKQDELCDFQKGCEIFLETLQIDSSDSSTQELHLQSPPPPPVKMKRKAKQVDC